MPATQTRGTTQVIALTVTDAQVATAAAIFQKILQNAIDMKSENDLTI